MSGFRTRVNVVGNRKWHCVHPLTQICAQDLLAPESPGGLRLTQVSGVVVMGQRPIKLRISVASCVYTPGQVPVGGPACEIMENDRPAWMSSVRHEIYLYI